MTTPFHAKYWAHSLSLASPIADARGLSRSIGSARVELNPHQVEAALFALRSPFSRGVLLADEVGLGKTIEAGLVLAQKWAERKRRLLLIVPATLRKQWQADSKTMIEQSIGRGLRLPFGKRTGVAALDRLKDILLNNAGLYETLRTAPVG